MSFTRISAQVTQRALLRSQRALPARAIRPFSSSARRQEIFPDADEAVSCHTAPLPYPPSADQLSAQIPHPLSWIRCLTYHNRSSFPSFGCLRSNGTLECPRPRGGTARTSRIYISHVPVRLIAPRPIVGRSYVAGRHVGCPTVPFCWWRIAIWSLVAQHRRRMARTRHHRARAHLPPPRRSARPSRTLASSSS